MKNIKTFEEFLNESFNPNLKYVQLEGDLEQTFLKSGIAKRCYNGELRISGSGWELDHPNGAITITFWLMDNVPTDKLIKTAKEWAKKHGLIAGTFYPNGVKDNSDAIKTQDWGDKAAQSAPFVYGFAFYSDRYALKKVYPALK